MSDQKPDYKQKEFTQQDKMYSFILTRFRKRNTTKKIIYILKSETTDKNY